MMNSDHNPPVRIDATLDQLLAGDYGLSIPNRPMEVRGEPLSLEFKVDFRGRTVFVSFRTTVAFLTQVDEAKKKIGFDVLAQIGRSLK